jgi:hypothetical protein
VNENVCWYCGKPSDAASIDEVSLYRDVSVSQAGVMTKRVKWSSTNVYVPRCPRCAKAHRLAEHGGNAFAKYGALVGAAGAVIFVYLKREQVLMYWQEYLFGAGVGLVAGFFAFGALGLIFSRLVVLGTRPRDTHHECPLVQARVAEGWRVGRPPDLGQLGD